MEHKQNPTFNGIHPEAKAAAEAAASAAGLTVEEWISRTILNIARGSAALVGPAGAGSPGAPPAVTVPNQKSVTQAAQAAGLPVDEWLSRAVLESLATSSMEGVADAAEPEPRANNTPGHSAPAEPVTSAPILPNTLPPATPTTALAPEPNEPKPAPGSSTAISPSSGLLAEPASPAAFSTGDDTALLEREPSSIEITKDSTAWKASPKAKAEIENAVLGFDPSGLDALQLTEALSTPPEISEPSGSGKRIAIGVGLGALIALALATWVVPLMLTPEPGADGKGDVATALPKAAPKPAAKAGTTGSAKRAAKPIPKINPDLPPPTKDTTALPQPAAKNVAWYIRAAELGNTKAQMVLAGLYLRGEGIAQDRSKAADLYRKAAVDGNEPGGQYALGVMLERGDGVKQDDIEALLWYRRAAAAGHPLAMYRAGLVHLTSKKVPRDFARAREYFETAARRGVPAANYQLGLIHEKGLGTAKSKAQAFDHFARASADGYKPAMEALARLTTTLSDEDIIRTTALPVPAEKHLAWYAKASKLGKTKAQLALAKLYLRGQGVDRDFAKAAALFRDAAARGRDPDAQYALAVMLERGMGTAKNQREALVWYRRAAKTGHSRALLNLGFAYVRGVGVPQDYKKAREYFEMAAAKNLAEAQYNLGLIYEHGLGIKKDVPMAFKWYSLAVANQNAPAGKALDRLIPRMSAAEIARAKQLLTQRN
jgi:TPR repeat protein